MNLSTRLAWGGTHIVYFLLEEKFLWGANVEKEMWHYYAACLGKKPGNSNEDRSVKKGSCTRCGEPLPPGIELALRMGLLGKING